MNFAAYGAFKTVNLWSPISFFSSKTRKRLNTNRDKHRDNLSEFRLIENITKYKNFKKEGLNIQSFKHYLLISNLMLLKKNTFVLSFYKLHNAIISFIWNYEETAAYNIYNITKALFFKAKYFAGFIIVNNLMKVLISPHHVWLICSTLLAHVRRFLWIHDDVDRNGEWKPIQHLCDLLLWNTVLVPPKGKTSVWNAVGFYRKRTWEIPKEKPKHCPLVAVCGKGHYPFLKDSDPRPGAKLNPQSVPGFNISYQADVCIHFFLITLVIVIKAIFHARNRGKNVMTGDNLQMSVHDLMLLHSRLNSGS